MIVGPVANGGVGVEFYPSVRLKPDGVLDIDVVLMDPATGDTLNSESYQCPLGPAVSFFAGL
jgi:hypothetical protein